MANLETQMRHRDKEMVPRFLVIAMFTVMGLSLALVSMARLTGRELVGVAENAPIISERTIVFEGDRHSPFVIRDETGAVIADSAVPGMGFVDVIGRVAHANRTSNGVATDLPLRLFRRDNGTLALTDDVTEWTLELRGYGQVGETTLGVLLNEETS